MQEALRALNQLVADRVIGAYAIGGAVGASFYIEAIRTEDVDAFVLVPGPASGLLMLTPIYKALSDRGGVIEREYVRFGDWPVQILTDATPLLSEAIRDAVSVTFHGIRTRVFTAEHLCAIALQTGRSKDYLRVRLFLEQGAVNEEALNTIVERYGLAEKLRKVREEA
jgi:hypothetical protein